MGCSRVLLLSIFVASAVAGPLKYSGDQCARHCTENSKLRYDQGVYTYDYEADTITTMQGTTHEESRLHMKAQVDFEVISKCELAMRIRNARLEYSDPRNPNQRTPSRNSREFSQSLERNVLRFAFQDGQVEHLCPMEGEEPWVLNIKKGILSTFQNSMSDLDVAEVVVETDVAGRCVAEYVTLGRNWRNILKIKKTKDLIRCTERSSTETALQGTPYTEQSVKSLPLVKGNQECEQTYSNNILQETYCTESHVFRPFSKQSNGAVTKATQKLTFNNQHNNKFARNEYTPKQEHLLFNHDYEQVEEGRRQQEAEQILFEVCNAARDEIRMEVPRLFTKLVYKLKQLDDSELMAVHRRVDRICSDNNRARKLFTDAISMVGTSGSVRLVKTLIERQEVKGSEADFWLTSLAFLPKPTTEMIAILTPLLDGSRYEQALLGISGLVHSFCRSHSDCGSIPEVREAVRRLVQNLGENCYSPETRKILLTLKSIGNIGQGFEASNVLQRCYQNPQLDTEIRLAAIQAYRRFSCDIPREDLLRLYSNYYEDSELRIAAYLAVMRCPTYSTINTVKNTLENEMVNQVGSFVWTHLVNLKESKNPLKKEIKEIVSSLYLMNKYNTDIRKFSRYMEGSIFSDSLDVGAHADGNVIYSPDSYIPRSAMFNLTFDIFGSTINLFEVGGRIKHLDQMVERLFGPKGYFSQSSVGNVIKNWRQERSVANNKISEMSDTFDAKNRYSKDPFGSMYLKIFGNEIWYSNFDFLTSQRDGFDMDEFFRELAKNQEAEFSKSFMFLDAIHTIPTGSGFPLRLAINGTASIGVKVGGKFEVKSLKDVDIRGKFQPSGAMEISSLMTVEAGNDRSGLKMVATLHSSTWMDGLIEVRNGEVMKLQMNLPRDKMEIIDVQSKIFLLHGEQEKEQKGATGKTRKMVACSGRYTKKLLGVELCSELHLPDSTERNDLPLFPMSGAAVASIYLRKTDPSLTSYNFEARWNNEKVVNGEYVRTALLTVNTPGSSVDRELRFEFNLNEPEKSFFLKVRTPVKKFGLSAKYTNVDIQKRFDVSVTVDDAEKFSIQSSLRADVNPDGGVYSPAIEVMGPSGRIVAITGSAFFRHGQRYTGQLNIEDLTEKPININANVDVKKKNRYEGQFSFSSFYIESTLRGFVQLANSISSKITLDYQFENGRRETCDFTAKFRDLSANSLTKYTGTISVQSSAKPQYTTAVTWEMQSTTGHVENTLQINLGDGRRSRMHKITLQQIVRYKGTLSNNNAALKLKMIYPEQNVDVMLDVNHANTEKSLNHKSIVQYATGKQVTLSTELNAEKNQVKGDIKVQYPGRDARLQINASRRSSQEYRAGLIAQWQRGEQVSVEANFKNINNKNQIRYEADAEISLPKQKSVTFSAALGAKESQYTLSGNLEWDRNKYEVNGNWLNTDRYNQRITMAVNIPGDVYSAEANLQGNWRRINGNADIRWSRQRHLTGNLLYTDTNNQKSGSLEIAWDADRNPSKVFAVNGQYSNADKIQGNIRIRTPDQNIQGTFTSSHQGAIMDGVFKTNHQLDIEWQPGKKISANLNADAYLTKNRRQLNGKFSLLTPFDKYKNYVLSVNHYDNGNEWKSDLERTLKSNVIRASSEGKYSSDYYRQLLNAKLRVTTNYRGYERFNGDIIYNYASNDFNGAINLGWGYDKKIGVGIFNRIVPGTTYHTGFNITSHYETAKEISGNALFTKNNEGYKVQIDSQWDDKNVNMVLDGKQMLVDKKRTCIVTAEVKTPLVDYERVFTRITYTNNGITANVDTETTWGYNRVTGGVTGSLKKISKGQILEGKAYYTTPFRNYEKFETSFTHFNDDKKFKSSVEIILPRTSKSTTLKGEGKWESFSDAQLNLFLSSPFKNFEQLSLDIDHTINGKNWRTLGEFTNKNTKITGELSGSHSSNRRGVNTEVYLQAFTPFKGYEEIKASFVHNQRDLEFLTIAQFSFNQDNNKFENNLKITDIFNFKEVLQISSPRMRNVQMIIEQTYNDNKVETKIKADTPFDKLKHVNIEGYYETDGRRYSPKLTIEWNRSKKIFIEVNLVNNRFKRMEGQATFTSPFSGYEYITAVGNYDITSATKAAEIKVQWDVRNNRQFTAKGSLSTDRNGGQSKLNIITPFQGYENIDLTASYVFNTREKSAYLQYQWGWKKIIVNGKHVTTANGAQNELKFTSPFETASQVVLSENHEFGDNIISGKTELQWNEKKTTLSAEFVRDGPRGSFSTTFTSPFRGYESILLEVKGDLYSARKTVNALFQRNVNRKYELSAMYQTSSNQHVIEVIVRTPFREYRELLLEGRLQNNPSEITGQLNYQYPNSKITFDGTIRHKDFYPTEITFNVDSPFSPLRNARFSTAVLNRAGQYELNSVVEWENVNKIELLLSAKNRDNRFYEGKVKLNTPFRKFRAASIEGSVRYDNPQSVQGRLNVITPFETLQNLDLTGSYQTSANSIDVLLTMNTPNKKLTISGRYANNDFRPVEIKLKINAPFTSFNTFSIDGKLNSEGWILNDGEFVISKGNDKHSLNFRMKNVNKQLQGEVKLDSSFIYWKSVSANYDVNYADTRNMEGTLKLETPNHIHRLSGNFRNGRRDVELNVKLNSPTILQHEEDLVFNFRYNNRRNHIELTASVIERRETHNIQAIYKNDNNGQLTVELNAVGKYFPANLNGKFINNNKITEVVVKLTTATETHSLEAIVKNYDVEKDIQIKLVCPDLSFETLTLTGSVRNDDNGDMNGDLIIATASDEVRVSGNMKRNSWDNFEAFVTINAPFETLKVGRIDFKFMNDQYKNIEGNLAIKTSNRNFRNFGVTGKLHRSDNANELSINFNLPSREYPTVGLLASFRGIPDVNSLSWTLTASLPGNRYSTYGKYEDRINELTGALGCEWGNSKKIEISGNLKRNNGLNGKLNVITPFRDYENQELSVSYRDERNQHNGGFNYKNARNEVVNLRGRLTYYNNMNFNVELNVATPYKGFEDIVGRLRQEYRRNKFVTAFDYTWPRQKKVEFYFENVYNRTHNSGQLSVNSPYETLRALKMAYSIPNTLEARDVSAYVKLDLNNEPIFNVEASSIYDSRSEYYNKNLMIDISRLPLKVLLHFKPLQTGAETTFKSISPSRSFSFHTLYQMTESYFSNVAELNWDEGRRSSLSYEIKLEDAPRDRNTKTIYGRINFPVRSLEVKGKHTKLQNVRNLEMDLYWDVARDPQQHLLLKFDHENQGNKHKTAHLVRVTAFHPRLSKDIVATGQISSTPSEYFGKVDLEYSRYQQHNLMLEARATNAGRRSRDTHYNMYVTARHLVSNLDLRLTGEVINTQEETSTNFKLNYLDRNRQQKVEELKAKISKLREQIDIIAKSNNEQVSLTGRMFNYDNELTMSLEQKVNERPAAHSHFRLSKRHMNMDLNITTPDRENLHVSAAMPQDAMHFQITHTNYGQVISDVLFHLGLKDSQILKSRLTWRPQMWQDMKTALSNKYTKISDTVSNTQNEISNEISNELNSKVNTIGQAMSRELAPFKQEMTTEMDRIRYDIERANNDIYHIYTADEFYLHTTVDAVGTVYDTLESYTKSVVKRTVEEIQELIHDLTDYYNRIIRSVSDFYKHNSRKISRMYNRFSKRMNEMMDCFVDCLKEILYDWATLLSIRISEGFVYTKNAMYDFLSKYAPSVIDNYHYYKGKIGGMYEDFINHPNVQTISKYWERIVNTIDRFRQQSLGEALGKTVTDTYDYVADTCLNWFEAGKRFRREYLDDYYGTISEHTSWVYRTLRLDSLVNTLVMATYERTKNFVLDTIQEFANVKSGIKYEFEPRQGRLTLEIPLPSPRRSLKEALDITTYPEFQKLAQLKEIYFSDEDYCLWDTYYKYKRYLEDSLKIPPFDTYAIIAGNQHYITFDKFHFDFVGECSYLLARDFVDGNFTVIVNYARDGRDVVKKSLTVLSDRKKIDIGMDYKVTVNDVKVDLPQMIGETSIMQENSVVTVKNSNGVMVRCNFVHDVCTLHISGFYFGKTAGLFGTYDYEPRLDMMTPDRRLTDDIDIFANSWEIGNAVCRREPNMAVVMTNDYRVREACKKLFDDNNSEFRPCYKQVKPLDFFNMCMKDLSRYDASMFDEKICTSAATYVSECNMAGVPVRMPKSCVRCEKHDGSIMNAGDVIKIELEQIQTADIVFIVERKTCNENAVRMLNKLAQGIEDSLHQKRYKNNRYAVVGFGGQNIFEQPHLQTNDGKEFGSIRSIDSAFNSLITGEWSDYDETSSSVFEAIRYAANLPFRVGAVKSFVLLKCSDCKAEEVKADYSEMLRTLLDSDITLHLLMEHDFDVKGHKQKNTKKVFGIDSNAAYTIKSMKGPSLIGDSDLLMQLKLPKDFCVPLAREVKGSVFNLQLLTETKKNTNKKFIDILSSRVTLTAEPSACQVCECISTEDGIGKSVCQRCVSPIVANMISGDISPVISNESDWNDDEQTTKRPKGKTRKSKN